MEIIGKNIPHLRNAISTGYDSIAAGILEGPAAINSAFDSFSAAEIGTFGALDLLPSVADVAQFPDPVAYFHTTESAVPANSHFVPHEFERILKDPRFNTATELTRVADNNFIDRLRDKIDKITYRIPSPSELSIPRPEPAHLGGPGYSKGSTAEARGPILKGRAEANDVTAAAMEKGKQLFSLHEPEYLEGEPTLTNKPDTGSASDADQRGIIIVGGKDDIASDKGIIIVGGKQDSLAQRGIIIVGGKTEGTYLETIDDTIAKLNQNPPPETLQLFQQQLGALQDMSSTVKQSIQVNQQLAAAKLTGRFRL